MLRFEILQPIVFLFSLINLVANSFAAEGYTSTTVYGNERFQLKISPDGHYIFHKPEDAVTDFFTGNWLMQNDTLCLLYSSKTNIVLLQFQIQDINLIPVYWDNLLNTRYHKPPEILYKLNTYHQNGSVASKLNLMLKKNEFGVLTNYEVAYFDKEKHLLKTTQFFKGIKNGKETSFYRNRFQSVANSGSFKDGKRIGHWKFYEIEFETGIVERVFQQKYSTGRLH